MLYVYMAFYPKEFKMHCLILRARAAQQHAQQQLDDRLPGSRKSPCPNEIAGNRARAKLLICSDSL